MVEPITVLVTAIGGGGHGEQIVKALRLAKQPGYTIVGGDASSDCPQFNLVDKPVMLPRADNPEFLNAILRVCKKTGAQAVFHGCEPDLRALSAGRAILEAEGLFVPINPRDVLETCMDKLRLSRVLEDLGLDPPRFLEIVTNADAERVDFFPIVLKPALGSGGSANTFICQNADELRAVMRYCDATGYIVQEYVGTPEEEFTVGVLHDMDGRYVNAIAVKRVLRGALNVRISVRNRTGRADLGDVLVISSGISHGHVGRFPEVTQQCRIIAERVGARGPINIQCRFVGGRVRLFEINPRFSGTTSIRALMDYNEPDVLLRSHFLGEKVSQDFPYREGLVLRSLIETVMQDERIPTWGEI